MCSTALPVKSRDEALGDGANLAPPRLDRDLRQEPPSLDLAGQPNGRNRRAAVAQFLQSEWLFPLPFRPLLNANQ
jgi:hypothetical protein